MVPEFQPDCAGYLFQQVADHLAARIRTGDLAPNQPLPAEIRLADEYGVSLGTVRHATRLLRSKGLVVIVPSKGTYVARIHADNEGGEQ